MIVDYILFFILGAASIIGSILLRRKYFERKDRRLTMKRAVARSEKDGWMKTDLNFFCWTTRPKMHKWHKELEEDLELCIWLNENTTGPFKVDWIDGKRYIKFDKDEDGMAFKLRWA